MSYKILLIAFAILTFSSCQNNTKKPIKEEVIYDKLPAKDAELKSDLPEDITEENHSFIMDAILGKPKNKIKSIGILVYDGVNDLDLMGPRYIFGQVGVRPKLVAIKSGNFKTVSGIEIKPDAVIDSVKQLDILVIPGGAVGTIEAAYNKNLLQWIREIDKNTTYTASVCTGAWVLGATGLLEGKKATTNWYRAKEMLNKYGASFTNERYTRDGKYWTSAGVTAGMDMSLAILNDNWGEKYTQGVMLDMEYDPAPPIIGGSLEKTSWLVEWMMNAMYDAGVQPLIDSLENIQ